jgi:hypothetical protein
MPTLLLLNALLALSSDPPALGMDFSVTFMNTSMSKVETMDVLKKRAPGFTRLKLYDFDPDTLAGIRQVWGSSGRVFIDISDWQLGDILTGGVLTGSLLTFDDVVDLIEEYSDIIEHIGVGNEPFFNGKVTGLPFGEQLVPACWKMYSVLKKRGIHQAVRITVPFSCAVLSLGDPLASNTPCENAGGCTCLWDMTLPPSAATFNPEYAEQMQGVLEFLNATGSVFAMNLYPYWTWNYYHSNVPLEYALGAPLPGGDSGGSIINTVPFVHDHVTGLDYTNLLDALMDMTYVALTKAGYPSLPLINGEIGWPTGGGLGGDLHLACQFTNSLLARMAGDAASAGVGTGTPLRPDVPLNLFLFEAYDEALKPSAANAQTGGTLEKNWGLFYANGTSKCGYDWASFDRRAARAASAAQPAQPAQGAPGTSDEHNPQPEENIETATDPNEDGGLTMTRLSVVHIVLVSAVLSVLSLGLLVGAALYRTRRRSAGRGEANHTGGTDSTTGSWYGGWAIVRAVHAVATGTGGRAGAECMDEELQCTKMGVSLVNTQYASI